MQEAAKVRVDLKGTALSAVRPGESAFTLDFAGGSGMRRRLAAIIKGRYRPKTVVPCIAGMSRKQTLRPWRCSVDAWPQARRTEIPPSASIGLPVTKDDRSDRRNNAACAISRASAIRFIG